MAASLRQARAITVLLGLLLVPLCYAQVPDFTLLVERYSAAVVSVSAEGPVAASENPLDYFRHFFNVPPGPGGPPPGAPGMPGVPGFGGPEGRQEMMSLGSGFIISSDGYVLTNAHVIEGAESVTIGLSDRREFKAKVIGADKLTDIALVKVDANNLPVTSLGDSTQLKVGQWVLAMGSPFGLERTATEGIVSALGRSLPGESYVPFIQTDAAVNPGNSGGPLFNLDGKVIGINSQIYSNSGGYMGVSFAIPINTAIEVADQLKKNGRVERGWLGIMIQDLTPDLAKSFGLERPRGALVSQIVEKGPGGKAGLEIGDVVVAYNGTPINRSSDLPPMVARTRPGSDVKLTVLRERKERTLTARIEQLPDATERAADEAAPPSAPSTDRLGVQVAPLPARHPGRVEGVLVTGVQGGPALRAGLQPGDVILRVNNIKVDTPEKFNKVVSELPAKKPIPILIVRDGGSFFLAITLE